MLPRHRERSVSLQWLTYSEEAGKRRFCEDVADRNISESSSRSRELSSASLTVSHTCQPNDEYIFPEAACSAKGARPDFVTQPTTVQGISPPDRPAKLPYLEGSATAASAARIPCLMLPPDGSKRRSLSHKPDISDIRSASGIHDPESLSLPASGHKPRAGQADKRAVRRWQLEKPLPPLPLETVNTHVRQKERRRSVHSKVHSWLAKDVGQAPDTPRSIMSPCSSEDTTFYKRWAPAVKHETITRKTHEIREERTTRETHEYHVYHRKQPIVEYEILPARHFVPVAGGFVEVSEDQVAGTPDANWIAEEIASKVRPLDRGLVELQAEPVGEIRNVVEERRDDLASDDSERTRAIQQSLSTLEGLIGKTEPKPGALHGSFDRPSDIWRARVSDDAALNHSPPPREYKRGQSQTCSPSMASLSRGRPPTIPPRMTSPLQYRHLWTPE